LSTISAGARALSALFHDENIYFGPQMRKSLTPYFYSAISLLIGREHCHVLMGCLLQNFGTDGVKTLALNSSLFKLTVSIAVPLDE